MVGSWCNLRVGKHGAMQPRPKKKLRTGAFGCHIHRVKQSFRVPGEPQLDGNFSGDVFPYAYIPKQYTRNHPYPKNTMRIAPMGREKAVIIMLRKKGNPINMIAKVLGRSTDFIHRTLRTAILRLCLRPMDMRKLPGKTRIYTSGFRWRKLLSLWPRWEAFLFGESEKPP